MGRKTLAGIVALTVLVWAGSALAVESVENCFIAGLDAGYFGYTGWLGDNFSGGVGGSLFFGYGITENFAMEIDWIPLATVSPTGDQVKDIYDTASWGGLGSEGGQFGGFGISGKLYPRGRFRDADFVNWQPFLTLGAGTLPFVFTYATDAKPITGETYDGFNVLYVNLGGGLEYMFTRWVGLNLNVRLYKWFQYGNSLQDYTIADKRIDNINGSMAYQAGLGLTFQW
jgi:hypothetical protein